MKLKFEVNQGRLKVESHSVDTLDVKNLDSLTSFCMWHICQDCLSCSWAVPKISVFCRLCVCIFGVYCLGFFSAFQLWQKFSWSEPTGFFYQFLVFSILMASLPKQEFCLRCFNFSFFCECFPSNFLVQCWDDRCKLEQIQLTWAFLQLCFSRDLQGDGEWQNWQAGCAPATRSSLLLHGAETFWDELKTVLYRILSREAGSGWLLILMPL